MRTTKAQISHSAFVIRCLDSIIPLVSISKISSLQLVSVAEQAGLSLTWLKTLKTGFLVVWLILVIFLETSVGNDESHLLCVKLPLSYHNTSCAMCTGRVQVNNKSRTYPYNGGPRSIFT